MMTAAAQYTGKRVGNFPTSYTHREDHGISLLRAHHLHGIDAGRAPCGHQVRRGGDDEEESRRRDRTRAAPTVRPRRVTIAGVA
jgi:hypothetical protein